jgi:hypothetical protein
MHLDEACDIAIKYHLSFINPEVAQQPFVNRFHHLHFYVDAIRPTEYYIGIEDRLNQLASRGSFDPFSGGTAAHRDRAEGGRTRERKRVVLPWSEIPKL